MPNLFPSPKSLSRILKAVSGEKKKFCSAACLSTQIHTEQGGSPKLLFIAFAFAAVRISHINLFALISLSLSRKGISGLLATELHSVLLRSFLACGGIIKGREEEVGV